MSWGGEWQPAWVNVTGGKRALRTISSREANGGYGPGNDGTLATATGTTTATATATPGSGKKIKVIGFSGASQDDDFGVVLKFGSTDKVTMYGAASNSVGWNFGDAGPAGAADEVITVVTTSEGTGAVASNIVYVEVA